MIIFRIIKINNLINLISLKKSCFVNMEFCIVSLEKKSKIEFIEYWSSVCDKYSYSPSDEDYYWPNIRIGDNKLEDLNAKNITCLLFWKNGGLNRWEKRKPIAEKAITHINTINAFRKKDSVSWKDFLDFYNDPIKDCTTGRIYGIFIAHIARPLEFPILDQHVLRAQIFITEKRKIIEKTSDEIINKGTFSDFLDLCYKPYIQFFNSIMEDIDISFRQIDRAIWMFGKYLKNKLKLRFLIE